MNVDVLIANPFFFYFGLKNYKLFWLFLDGILHCVVSFFIIEKYVMPRIAIAPALIGSSYSFRNDMAVVPTIPNDETIEKPTVLQLVHIPDPAPTIELNKPAPTFLEFDFIIRI